jgi:hypothetical protein
MKLAAKPIYNPTLLVNYQSYYIDKNNNTKIMDLRSLTYNKLYQSFVNVKTRSHSLNANYPKILLKRILWRDEYIYSSEE